MAPTAQATQNGYANLWNRAVVTKPVDADHEADRILANKTVYKRIEEATGVPWPMVGVIHLRESNLNFNTHLHNGDSLDARTHNVPSNRPSAAPKNGLRYTFEESAIDALTMPGKAFQRYRGQWSLELMLFCEESYNGWGYLLKGNSPYIWSWTSEYHGGKYVADHEYRSDVWDSQPGTAAIMKALAHKDADAAAWINRRATRMPADAHVAATQSEKKGVAVGTVAAGTGGTATQSQTSTPEGVLVKSLITFTGMGVGLVITVVALFVMWRKRRAIAARFGNLPVGTATPADPAAPVEPAPAVLPTVPPIVLHDLPPLPPLPPVAPAPVLVASTNAAPVPPPAPTLVASDGVTPLNTTPPPVTPAPETLQPVIAKIT